MLVLGLIVAESTPRTRNPAVGLVPTEVGRSESGVPSLPPAGASVAPPHGAEAASVARRAEITAEEARLAGLREARVALEQELVTLRQEAEQRRREAGYKVGAGSLTTGSAAAIQPATGPQPAPAAAATPAPASPAPAAEPAANRGLRIFVHHRASSPAATAAAEELIGNLRGGGFEVQPPRPVPFVPSTPVVRYFHEEDQAAAARLASRLGRGWAIQDFRAYVPQPPPQTLEVWMPGG